MPKKPDKEDSYMGFPVISEDSFYGEHLDETLGEDYIKNLRNALSTAYRTGAIADKEYQKQIKLLDTAEAAEQRRQETYVAGTPVDMVAPDPNKPKIWGAIGGLSGATLAAAITLIARKADRGSIGRTGWEHAGRAGLIGGMAGAAAGMLGGASKATGDARRANDDAMSNAMYDDIQRVPAASGFHYSVDLNNEQTIPAHLPPEGYNRLLTNKAASLNVASPRVAGFLTGYAHLP
jgi:hypothetical protein